MKGNGLTISPRLLALDWLDRLGKGRVWRAEGRGLEGSESCSAWMDSGRWKWIAAKTGGAGGGRWLRGRLGM